MHHPFPPRRSSDLQGTARFENMEDREYLTGQLLIAMPGMRDSRFARTVIYVCAHHPDGAMGLVINRLVGAITFPDLLAQLGIGPLAVNDEIREIGRASGG